MFAICRRQALSRLSPVSPSLPTAPAFRAARLFGAQARQAPGATPLQLSAALLRSTALSEAPHPFNLPERIKPKQGKGKNPLLLPALLKKPVTLHLPPYVFPSVSCYTMVVTRVFCDGSPTVFLAALLSLGPQTPTPGEFMA